MKKGIVNVLILVLCLANTAMTAITLFTVIPTLKSTSVLVNRICEIVNLDIGNNNSTKPEGEVSLSDLVSQAVSFVDGSGASNTTTVKLRKGADGKEHYLKVGVSINMNKKHEDFNTYSATMADSMAVINNIIIDVISGYSYDEADMKTMQNAVLRELQAKYNSSFIYSVTFSPFTLQ